MKNIVKIILLSIVTLNFAVGYAQENKSTTSKIQTETFTVEGACSMCKTRIENAALLNGVKSADWDMNTHTITVVYNPQKVSLQAIHQSIANAGHQTSLLAPNMEAYKKFPACCAYLKGGESNCGHKH